jgi:hypothetical protein
MKLPLSLILVSLPLISCGGDGEQSGSIGGGASTECSDTDLLGGGSIGEWGLDFIPNGTTFPPSWGLATFEIWDDGETAEHSDGDIYLEGLVLDGLDLTNVDLGASYTWYLDADHTFTATISIPVPDVGMSIVRSIDAVMNEDKLSMTGTTNTQVIEDATGIEFAASEGSFEATLIE